MTRYLVLALQVISWVAAGQPESPKLFQPGVINTGAYESHPAFSPDGNTLYFLRCTPDVNNFCAICISRLSGGQWSVPAVAPFSGQYYDIDPFVSPDGKYVYFCSNRPADRSGVAKSETDIWRVAITSNGWGDPQHLDGPINSTFDEYYPTLSNRNVVYFGSTRNGKDSNIFRSAWSDGTFRTPEILGDSINTVNQEYEPFIAPDESYLIFMATIPQGLTNADFYISYNRNGEWTKANKLPEPINSPFTEWSPKVTADNKYFFFSSTRSTPRSGTRSSNMIELEHKLHAVGNGLGDIYFLDASQLKLKK